MRRQFNSLVLIFTLSTLFLVSDSFAKSEKLDYSRIEVLSANWKMMPTDKLNGSDEKLISENGYNTISWFKAIVPGTVLGSWASTGYIKDPYFGINMQQIDPTQFKQPWWFRTTFLLDTSDLQKKVSLRFHGINYRADLWVNGKKVVGKDTFAGTYRMFTFNINDFINAGENTVALKM